MKTFLLIFRLIVSLAIVVLGFWWIASYLPNHNIEVIEKAGPALMLSWVAISYAIISQATGLRIWPLTIGVGIFFNLSFLALAFIAIFVPNTLAYVTAETEIIIALVGSSLIVFGHYQKAESGKFEHKKQNLTTWLDKPPFQATKELRYKITAWVPLIFILIFGLIYWQSQYLQPKTETKLIFWGWTISYLIVSSAIILTGGPKWKKFVLLLGRIIGYALLVVSFFTICAVEIIDLPLTFVGDLAQSSALIAGLMLLLIIGFFESNQEPEIAGYHEPE